jgi:hypothetical protein
MYCFIIMDYYKKYLKYKTKYNELKILKDKTLEGKTLEGGSLNLILPSDINNYTQKFIIKVDNYKNKFKELLKDKFQEIYHDQIISMNSVFIQDPAIILNQSDKKYIIRVEPCDYNVPELVDATVNNDFKTDNELLFGGNFISVPSNINIPNDLGSIIMTKTLDVTKNLELDKLVDFLTANINDKQKLIKINCSFQHKHGSIHVDELLCPMPYKSYELFPGYNMNYKIWIYKIHDITFDTEKLKNQIEYNFNIDPRNTDTDIGIKLRSYNNDELQDLATKVLDAHSAYWKIPITKRQEKNNFKQITKIIDKNGINTFDYDDIRKSYEFFIFINKPTYNLNVELYNDVKNTEVLKQKLLQKFNDELEENKKIIGSSIFTPEIYTKYKDEINKLFFVEYPIDLILLDINNNGYYEYNMIEPPIFNRVYIKLEDRNICIFPVKNKPSKLLLDFIKHESELMIPNINFDYIDTCSYHIKGKAGGNIHCLSKQIFK